MAKEIFKDEILDDTELDGVAGGTYTETFQDMDYITKHTGIAFSGDSSERRDQLRTLLWNAGIKLKDHGGGTPNDYYVVNTQTGEKGPKLTRDEALYRAAMEIRRQNGLY